MQKLNILILENYLESFFYELNRLKMSKFTNSLLPTYRPIEYCVMCYIDDKTKFKK